MKIKLSIIFYVVFSVIFGLNTVNAANLNKSFDLRVETISTHYNDQITKAIRKEFNEFLELKKQYLPDDFYLFSDAEKYSSLYSEKFIALEFEDDHFGGFWTVIAIGPKNPKYFCVSVYNIGSDDREEWDVTSIEELFFDSERLAQLEKIKSQKYAGFWQ